MKNFSKIFFYIILFLFILAVSFAYPAVDTDFWARLLQGYSVLETGSVMYLDPFSYIPTHAWIDHEWGSGVIFALVQNCFGYTGQIVLKALLMFFTMFFVLQTIKLRGIKNTKLHNFLFFLFVIYSLENSIFSGIRCQNFTFLFFAVFLYLLELVRIKQNYKILIAFPFMMLFWGNVHGGCVSGLGLILLYAIGEFLNKKPFKYYLYTFAASTAVLVVNPYGLDYLNFLLSATTMSRTYIVEWRSIFDNDFLILLKSKIFAAVFLAVAAGSLVGTVRRKEKIDYTKYIVLFMMFSLAFAHIKHFPLLIFASTALLYDDFFFFFNGMMKKIRSLLKITSETFIRNFVTVKECIVYVLVILEIIFLFNVYKKTADIHLFRKYPVKMVEFIKENDLKGNLLNHFDIGSFLSYKLFPVDRIYMDGRYEEVYYDKAVIYNWSFYNDSDSLDGKEKWNTLFEVYGLPDYIIVGEDSLVYAKMKSILNYQEIFKDNKYHLYVRKDLQKLQYVTPEKDDKYYKETYFDRSFKFSKPKNEK
ncbi:MAG: hypothetical protein K6C94_03550 [Candidatus Gastranaerophilales bacterium]|nr:hypothetical protein [Candidatus Gastranaerophilales bacterium]